MLIKLKDASGYNADLGYRGNIYNYINFDIGLFTFNTTTTVLVE
jgi:hypothetical protein